MEVIKMPASSFVKSAMKGSKAPRPSGMVGSHHKASDSKPVRKGGSPPVQKAAGGSGSMMKKGK
jgi:hypothetical protein